MKLKTKYTEEEVREIRGHVEGAKHALDSMAYAAPEMQLTHRNRLTRNLDEIVILMEEP
jgi:hypothetical protein